MNNKYMIEADEMGNNDLITLRKVVYNVKVYNNKSKYRMIIKDLNKTMSLDITNIVKDLKKER